MGFNCFLNLTGIFGGKDLHLYMFALPPPTGVPIVNFHWVAQIHPIGRFWRVTKSVSHNGAQVLQSGWAMQLVPHEPIPVPPHATEWGILALVILTATSTPMLSVHGVSAEGSPKLVEWVWAFGANVDCSLIPFPPLNIDVNYNSVTTNATKADYIAGTLGTAIGGVYSMFSAVPEVGWGVGITLAQALSDMGDQGKEDPQNDESAKLLGNILRWVDLPGRSISNLQGAVQEKGGG